MNNKHIMQAAAGLIQFLKQLVLGIVAAILYALPWLLRIISIVAWLVSLFMCIQTIETIYSPFSDEVPLFALQFGAVLLMVLWAMVGMMAGKQVWGILAAGAIILGLITQGAAWLSAQWLYADLFFRVLPSVLLAVGMITLGIRTRAKRFKQFNINSKIAGISA